MKDNWILVKDQLPEEDKKVLVVDEFNTMKVMSFYNGGWEDVEGFYDDSGIEKIYWMPLPDPPTLGDR